MGGLICTSHFNLEVSFSIHEGLKRVSSLLVSRFFTSLAYFLQCCDIVTLWVSVGASELNSHIKLSKTVCFDVSWVIHYKYLCLKCKCNMNTIIDVGVVGVNISILYLHQSTRTICSCYVCSGKDGLENVVGKISFNQHNLSHIIE